MMPSSITRFSKGWVFLPIASWLVIISITTSFTRCIERGWRRPFANVGFRDIETLSANDLFDVERRRVIFWAWSNLSAISYLAVLIWCAVTLRHCLRRWNTTQIKIAVGAIGLTGLAYLAGVSGGVSFISTLTLPLELPDADAFFHKVDAQQTSMSVRSVSVGLSVVGFFAAFASLAAVCATLDSTGLPRTADKAEVHQRLKKVLDLIKFFPYVGAALLFSSIGRADSVMRYYAKFADTPKSLAETYGLAAPKPAAADQLADALSLFTGVGYSAVIFATFLPAVVLISGRLHATRDSDDANDSGRFSTPEWIATALAIVSPIIAGATGSFWH